MSTASYDRSGPLYDVSRVPSLQSYDHRLALAYDVNSATNMHARTSHGEAPSTSATTANEAPPVNMVAPTMKAVRRRRSDLM